MLGNNPGWHDLQGDTYRRLSVVPRPPSGPYRPTPTPRPQGRQEGRAGAPHLGTRAAAEALRGAGRYGPRRRGGAGRRGGGGPAPKRRQGVREGRPGRPRAGGARRTPRGRGRVTRSEEGRMSIGRRISRLEVGRAAPPEEAAAGGGGRRKRGAARARPGAGGARQ